MTYVPYYILDGRTPVPCHDVLKWGLWFATADRKVAHAQISPEISVSTVFIGLNYRFEGGGPPLVFETMTFGGLHDGERTHTATWGRALEAHRRAVERASQ